MSNSTEINNNVTTEVWVSAIFATFITSLVSLVGVFFVSKTVPSVRSRHEDFFKNAISFAIGVILSTVFIHLMPEADHLLNESDHSDHSDHSEYEEHEEGSWKGASVFLGGIFLSVLLEVVVHQHSHHKTERSNPNNDVESDVESYDSFDDIEPVAYTVLLGDAFHNFSDGFLIATAFMVCGQSLGWIVMASVILHEIPHELLDFIILMKAGLPVKKALFLNFLSSLPSILGAVIILAVNPSSLVQGYIIKFSSGILTFVALSQLLPSISKDDHKKPIHIFLMLLGMVLIGLLELYHPECH